VSDDNYSSVSIKRAPPFTHNHSQAASTSHSVPISTHKDKSGADRSTGETTPLLS